MSDKEIELLLAEALDAFDDPAPLPAVAAGDVGRRISVSKQLPFPAVAGRKSISAGRSSYSVMKRAASVSSTIVRFGWNQRPACASIRTRVGLPSVRVINWRVTSAHLCSWRLFKVAAHLSA